tara:strand:+ start:1103 stop:1531 length:429 start_codon:yes stop_codon:yes gene_type:complete
MKRVLEEGDVSPAAVILVDDCKPGTYLVSDPTHKVPLYIDDSIEYYIELPFNITDNYKLYVLAHEVGHVKQKHLTETNDLHLVVKEFQAEMWALSLLHKMGINLTAKTVNEAKTNVLNTIEDSPEFVPPTDIILWAANLLEE